MLVQATPEALWSGSRSKVPVCHGVQDATSEDVQGIALGIQHSLKNHEGKGVQRINEGSPAKWRLTIDQ